MSDAPIGQLVPLIPREELAGWRRWHGADLSAEPTAPAAPRPSAAELARREAERHAAQLRAEREAARREGLAQGHAEGLAQGLAEGRRQGEAQGREAGAAAARAEGEVQIQASLARLQALYDSGAQAIERLAADTAPALTELALAVARRLIVDELNSQPEAIVRIVEHALQDVPADTRVRIHVHPEDAALLHEHMGERLPEHGWRVVADDGVTRGGCRLVTSYGEIDATLQTRWAHVAASFGSDMPWQAP